jgi:hypothetical protein
MTGTAGSGRLVHASASPLLSASPAVSSPTASTEIWLEWMTTYASIPGSASR